MNPKMKTGDLLLFSDHTTGWFSYFTDMIKYATHSNYSHVAMILKDPSFIHPSLKGYYVWESSYEGTPDPQDDKIKLGVQITPLHEILEKYKKEGGHTIWRPIEYKTDPFTEDKLSQIHKVVYDKPYDIVPSDWVDALKRKDPEPQKTSRFWCSALIAYIYTKIGILNSTTDWTIVRPNDFSLADENLNYTNLDEAHLSTSESRLF